jgi:hypothetical protein
MVFIKSFGAVLCYALALWLWSIQLWNTSAHYSEAQLCIYLRQFVFMGWRGDEAHSEINNIGPRSTAVSGIETLIQQLKGHRLTTSYWAKYPGGCGFPTPSPNCNRDEVPYSVRSPSTYEALIPLELNSVLFHGSSFWASSWGCTTWASFVFGSEAHFGLDSEARFGLFTPWPVRVVPGAAVVPGLFHHLNSAQLGGCLVLLFVI